MLSSHNTTIHIFYVPQKEVTVKPVFFVCLFFRDLGDVAEIKAREYSKSRAIVVYYLVQQAKTQKLGTPK